MKAMFTAFAAIIIIAVGANLALERAGFSIQDFTTGSAVRLG